MGKATAKDPRKFILKEVRLKIGTSCANAEPTHILWPLAIMNENRSRDFSFVPYLNFCSKGDDFNLSLAKNKLIEAEGARLLRD